MRRSSSRYPGTFLKLPASEFYVFHLNLDQQLHSKWQVGCRHYGISQLSTIKSYSSTSGTRKMMQTVAATSHSAGSSGGLLKQDESLVINEYLSSRYGSPAGIMMPAGRLPLTKECKHYSSYDEMPENLQK